MERDTGIGAGGLGRASLTVLLGFGELRDNGDT
jgi:hypothetical protein